MRSTAARHRQGGAFIVTAAFLLLFLLGFMGIALDFGHLFVVKTELQTAMDSCALAAAQELDDQGTALDRARNAGVTAGNMNRVDMQSATWGGQGQVVLADITFRDAAYVPTAVPAAARYVQCQHTQTNINMWLLDAVGAFSGDTANFPATRNVTATAVARRASAQTTCPLPVAMHPKKDPDGNPRPGPDYGFTIGEWIPLLHSQPADPGGKIGWANLDTDSPTNSASEIEKQLKGFCGTRVNDPLKPIESSGTMSSLVEPWNYRFGIYKKLPQFGVDPAYTYPDYSGYSYTTENWPSGFNAWSGSGPSGVANFKTNRTTSAQCAATVKSCESTINRKLNSFKDVATVTQHGQYGSNRRIVVVPVVNGSSQVIDYACMLMLQPLSIPFNVSEEVMLEYLGNAGATGSPCVTSGLPGGVAGPLIPVLVR